MSSSWCHFDVVQDPPQGNPCSALIRSCPDNSTGFMLLGASAGSPCQLCRATRKGWSLLLFGFCINK